MILIQLILHFVGLSGFDITLEAEQEEPTTPVSSAVATSRYSLYHNGYMDCLVLYFLCVM